jgi:hypothetical protein
MAATIVAAACGSDSSTGPPPPPTLTAAQWALHFDSLAGQLQQSSPGDARIQWFQEMVRVLARGAIPTGVTMRLEGGPAFVEAVTEVDQFSSPINAKLTADSTYILAAWAPSFRPTQFLDVHVSFLHSGGQTDTTRTLVTLNVDTLGHTVVDSTAVAGGQAVSARGSCVFTQLTYLTVETNACTRIEVGWSIVGGTGLASINPAFQISGVHLTP